jgi:hypothetical protein
VKVLGNPKAARQVYNIAGERCGSRLRSRLLEIRLDAQVVTVRKPVDKKSGTVSLGGGAWQPRPSWLSGIRLGVVGIISDVQNTGNRVFETGQGLRESARRNTMLCTA